MAKVARTIEINAPVSKVFDFVTNPDNWTKYVGSLIKVSDLTNNPPVKDTTFKWIYRMLGVDLGGKGRVSSFEKDKEFTMQMEGSFPIREIYIFDGDDANCFLTVEVEYEMPGKILGVISKSSVIEKLNIKEADAVLDKIKTFCEET